MSSTDELCTHDETFSDGTTVFCSHCGQTVRWFHAATEEWIEGEVSSDQFWTINGWLWRD